MKPRRNYSGLFAAAGGSPRGLEWVQAAQPAPTPDPWRTAVGSEGQAEGRPEELRPGDESGTGIHNGITYTIYVEGSNQFLCGVSVSC